MPIKTFKKALEFDEMVSIGGGEPTIHPKFWELLGLAIGHSDYVWLATNGKKTETALALAKIAFMGVIGCDLSQDAYHEEIDASVVMAFTKTTHDGVSGGYDRQNNDSRAIRDVTSREINAGRCDFGEEGCVCSDLVCEPDGTIRACGCEGAPTFGNVNDEVVIPDEWNIRECYREQTDSVWYANR
jgi:MoaA/NifB/PqqE/SkfB family radical SAM enzyme